MGDFATLSIGRKYTFTAMSHQIPYAWCMIFDEVRPVRKGIYKTSVSYAKEKLASKGITMDNIERQIAEFSGCDREHWVLYRESIHLPVSHRHRIILDQERFEEEDEFNADFELEEMEELDGIIDLPALYRLAIALEYSKVERTVTLDLKDFVGYYTEDGENPEKIIPDVRSTFVSKVNAYNYLFAHVVGIKDRQLLVHERIRLLTEDQVIDQVAIPILRKLGFHNVERVPYHGPHELGLDIRPFYEVDKFNNRVYYGAQVKAINIHTDSRKEGHVEGVAHQLLHALDSRFIDKEDNEKKQIDRIMLLTSQRINDSAKEVLNRKFPNRTLILIDGEKLAEYITKYDLAEGVLQSKTPYRRSRK